jgi:hypothetical protein
MPASSIDSPEGNVHMHPELGCWSLEKLEAFMFKIGMADKKFICVKIALRDLRMADIRASYTGWRKWLALYREWMHKRRHYRELYIANHSEAFLLVEAARSKILAGEFSTYCEEGKNHG